MPSAIDGLVKRRVVQQWLSGEARDKNGNFTTYATAVSLAAERLRFEAAAIMPYMGAMCIDH